MILLKTHIVPGNTLPIRLIDYILEIFPEIQTRSSAKKVLKKGAVKIDGEIRPSGWWIKPGMKLELYDTEEKPPKILPLKLDIIYEDDYIAVINKPAGIAVSGNKYHTIQNALIYNLKPSASPDSMPWPKPVHRLDVPTTGLLLIAKTKHAAIDLGNQFENKIIKKRYRAIVQGKLPLQGIIETDIEHQTAKTIYQSVEYILSPKTEWITLVDLFPETGRKHQLRIHLSSIGYPIVGDKQYTTDKPLLKGKGLFLSAVEIEFRHPDKGKTKNFSIKQPSKFDALIRKEKRNFIQ